MSFEVFVVDVKVFLPVLQGIVAFLLDVGDEEVEATVEGIDALNAGETKSLIDTCALQETNDVVNSVDAKREGEVLHQMSYSCACE